MKLYHFFLVSLTIMQLDLLAQNYLVSMQDVCLINRYLLDRGTPRFDCFLIPKQSSWADITVNSISGDYDQERDPLYGDNYPIRAFRVRVDPAKMRRPIAGLNQKIMSLSYKPDSKELIPFDTLLKVQVSSGDPVYAFLKPRLNDVSNPLLIEVVPA